MYSSIYCHVVQSLDGLLADGFNIHRKGIKGY